MGLLAVAGDDPEPSRVVFQFKCTRNFWQKTNHIHTQAERSCRKLWGSRWTFIHKIDISQRISTLFVQENRIFLAMHALMENSRALLELELWHSKRQVKRRKGYYLFVQERDGYNKSRIYESFLLLSPSFACGWWDVTWFCWGRRTALNHLPPHNIMTMIA